MKQNPGRKPKILVLGVGNLLMGDEGVGVHFVRSLKKKDFPWNVTILDGGTAGLQLLEYLEETDISIIIDATLDKNNPGTIQLIQPKFSTDYPPSLSTHDIGMKDLVDGLTLMGKLPKVYLFTITIDGIRHMDMELSDSCQNAIPRLRKKILNLIKKINGEAN